MENNFYIASHLAKITNTKEETERINSWFYQISDNAQAQRQFYEYCLNWKLAPWIYVQLNKSNLFNMLNSDVQHSFRIYYESIKGQNENRKAEALNFLKEFKNEGIDVAVLKGNLFIDTVYHNSGYKKMNDFDMLIRVGDWQKVQKIYHKLSYIPLGNGWNGEKGDVAKFSHTGLSFISPNYHCITGTQWGLKSPTSKYKVDMNDLWVTTTNYNYHGLEIKQLSPEYNLLHLILHMGTYKCGIRDCMDIYNLMLTTKIDYKKLTNIIYRSNAVDKAWFTLQLTNLCSDCIDRDFLNSLQPKTNSFLVRRLHSRLKMAEKSGDMQRSYNDHFQNVEILVFYFGLFPAFHKKVFFFGKIVRQMFFPKGELAYKFSDLDKNPSFVQKIIARIKAPYFSFKLIGEEIGLNITFFLFIKLFIDTIFSVRFYFISKETYFEYLRKRGVDPKEIQRVVKGIQ